MTESDRDQIVRIFEVTLPAMVRTRNIDGYVDLFTDDAAWCPPDNPDRFGRAAIHEGVSELLAHQDIDPAFTADEALAAGDFGYVLGWSKEILIPHGGGPRTVAWSRELWLFARRDGDWKIARLIFNLKQDESQLGAGPDSPCRLRLTKD